MAKGRKFSILAFCDNTDTVLLFQQLEFKKTKKVEDTEKKEQEESSPFKTEQEEPDQEAEKTPFVPPKFSLMSSRKETIN